MIRRQSPMRGTLVFLLLLAGSAPARGRADDAPPAVPPTRAALKEMLERSKHSTPRLPLPPPTEAEKAAAEKRGSAAPGLGGIINNGRMRQLYLEPALAGAGGLSSREPDPAMTLDNAFKTMCFWLVSRVNNCAYCLGHQEVKLAASGVAEDAIAALDGDWHEFTPAQRAAFAFTVKLTREPQAIADADLDALKAHYTPTQALEILLAVANFNAINRWTGGLAIPQEDHRDYDTPTAPAFADLVSRVAPLTPNANGPAAAPPSKRTPPTPAETAAALEAARTRRPRLPLADESAARAALPADWPEGPLPQWARLLAVFPKQGAAKAVAHRATIEHGVLSPKLRALIDATAARHDRAWYALGHARKRLESLGVDADAIESADAPLSKPERAAVVFARALTVDPARISDADVAVLRDHFSDREVAELVYRVTEAAFFDRLTEAANLPLEF
jgi:alkylhydroperoxidase family enzyme